jgi:hypothetical protein
MKTVWEQIPMFVKVTTGITAAVAAAIMWLLSTFETTMASEQKWASHNQALQCRTVNSLKIKIIDLEEKARKATDQGDREFYQNKLKYIREEIKRLDPKGVC